MDLSFLIPSKMRRLILTYFVDNPDAQVGIRELAAELKKSPQVTYRELLNLESWGILFSSRRGNQRAFRLNRKFPLISPLRELFERYRQEQKQGKSVEVVKTYNLKETTRRLRRITTPPELIPGLTAKRTKPRSFDEDKFLRKASDP